jgi:peptide/nickel transport system permease protein
MYVILRIAAAVPTLLGVTLFAFLLVHMAPGDPLSALTQGYASQEVLERLRSFYGFDLPLPVQYLHWLGRVVVGDFGASFSTGRSVAPELLAALNESLKILALAVPVTVVAGWWLGDLAAWQADKPLGRMLTVVLGSFVSIPSYWLGLVLVAVFGVILNWLPVMGMGPTTSWSGWFTYKGLTYLVLPVAALVIAPIGILARSTKTAIETVIASDFPEALRARGMPDRYIRSRVARNALPGLFPIYGLQISYMFSGLVLVEAIFAWPGLGNYLTLAITARDIPSIQAGILLSAAVFVLLNLIADLLQGSFDRRTRR